MSTPRVFTDKELARIDRAARFYAEEHEALFQQCRKPMSADEQARWFIRHERLQGIQRNLWKMIRGE